MIPPFDAAQSHVRHVTFCMEVKDSLTLFVVLEMSVNTTAVKRDQRFRDRQCLAAINCFLFCTVPGNMSVRCFVMRFASCRFVA
jgi:hypothetical protein